MKPIDYVVLFTCGFIIGANLYFGVLFLRSPCVLLTNECLEE